MRHTIPPAAILAVTAGLLTGAAGLLPTHHADLLATVGLLTTLAALPVVVYWTQRRAQQVAADQLADAHTAGYRLALDHVARGLLEPPTTAPTGDGGHADFENVRRLPTRVTGTNNPERKAQ
jgi:hypothetical protein